jgi:hypothetical protein
MTVLWRWTVIEYNTFPYILKRVEYFSLYIENSIILDVVYLQRTHQEHIRNTLGLTLFSMKKKRVLSRGLFFQMGS